MPEPLPNLDIDAVLKMSQAISCEIVFEKLVAALMRVAADYAGAERALLVAAETKEQERPQIEAEAIATSGETMISLRRRPISGEELPESVFNYVRRTQQSLVLQDALEPSPFSDDPYVRGRRARSVLCLPLVKQARLVAVLYLENNLASRVFTAERTEVLRLVASQAAISLDHARLYAELQEAGLYLAEAQQLSHTGSFGWRPSTGEVIWSDETNRIFGHDRPGKATLDWILDRVHPDDRALVIELMERVTRDPVPWEIEHRLLFPDGSIKHLHVVSRPVQRGSEIEFVGAVMDVTARKAAEQSNEEKHVLHLANERLALALRGSNVGVFDFDLRGGSPLETSPMYSVNIREQLGYDPGPTPDRMHFERCHVDDREKTVRDLETFVRGRDNSWQGEWRVQHSDGSYRWWLHRGVTLRDAEGKPTRLIGSCIDITDRKLLEGQLLHAKEVAETANRAKDRFMANVSHEIRTPMNAILGMTELALEEAVGQQQRLSLSTVKSAAENLLVIIEGLLDFARIEAGRVVLATRPFSLRQVLGECLREHALGAHRKGLDLVLDVAPDLPDQVAGDPVRLRQVLVNLVGNAIKFTDRGEVMVSARPAGDRVRFSVQDTGIGIANERRHAIFEAFEQADDSTSRRYGGTGLGLTIAARLATLMNGTIDVESEPGKGSTFVLTAQLEPGAPVVPPAVPRILEGVRVLVADDNASTRGVLERWLRAWGMRPTVVGDAATALASLRQEEFPVAVVDGEMDGLAPMPDARVVLLGAIELPQTVARFRELGGAAHVAKPAMPDELQAAIVLALEGREAAGVLRPAPHFAPRRLRVLVAEDNELNQQLMRQLLASRGHEVAVAGSGPEALARVEASRFDALLLDVRLPDLDGFGVIAAIRKREGETGGHLHVVATTARARPADREACLAAGMDDFLPKPISAAALWTALERVVKGPAPASLIDARVLLGACNANSEILGKISTGLRASLPKRLSALERAFAEKDARSLRETAHALAGLVSPFSSIAGRLASDLEERAARGDVEVSALVEQLSALAPDLIREVGDLSVDALRSALR